MNFTKRALESLPAPKKTELCWDSAVRGLLLKCEPTGHRVFAWSRRANTRQLWKTIGEYESVSLDDARGAASKYNTQLAEWIRGGFEGTDPFAAPRSMTLGEAVDAYKDRHIAVNAKRPEAAAENVTWQMDRYADGWRDKKLSQIPRADAVKLHEDVRKEHKSLYAANRLIQLLRAAVNWFIKAGVYSGANPFTGIRLFHETKRKRFLLAPELGALKRALDSPETSLDLRDYVHLSLFCGARKMDTLSMRWRDVDFDHNTWLVPEPKNSESYHIALPAAAVAVLKERRELAERKARKEALPVSEFVFPSHGATGHVMDLKKGWAKLLKSAGITDLRQHDNRRTLGSWQAAGGASLQVIGKSLGHKSIGSTAIYAQLQLDPIRASVEAATIAMSTAMLAKPAPQLVAPPKKRRAAAAVKS